MAGASLLLLLHAACVSGPIRVEANDAAPIARAATIQVVLAAPADAVPAQPGGAIARRLDLPLGAELEDALAVRTERALEARGYAIGDESGSDLVLEIAPFAERVARRIWSSDPDASALRKVEQSEAVLALRARDASTGEEIWRGEARTKLPESAHPPGARAEALWSRLLDRALERVPQKR